MSDRKRRATSNPAVLHAPTLNVQQANDITRLFKFSIHRDSYLIAICYLTQHQHLVETLFLDFPCFPWGCTEDEFNGKINQFFNCIQKCLRLTHLNLGGAGLFLCPIPQMQGIGERLVSLTLHQLNDSLSHDLSNIFQAPFSLLEYLDLRYSESITNCVLEAMFGSCVNLKDLCLVHCSPVTAEGFASMHRLASLRVFHLNGCGVNGDQLLQHIAKCKSLQNFQIFNTLELTAQAAIRCVEQLPLPKFLLIKRVDHIPALAHLQGNFTFQTFRNIVIL